MCGARRHRCGRLRTRSTIHDDNDRGIAGRAAPTRALADFDAVLDAQGPAVRHRSTATPPSCWSAPSAEGARVLNRPARAARLQREARDPALPAIRRRPPWLAREWRAMPAFLDEHRDIIVKTLDGMGGTMIFRVAAADPNRNVIVEAITDMGARTVMAQRYHPRDHQRRQARAGDRRGSRCPIASRASPRRARPAATSPPAAPAWRSRSRRATARSPKTVGTELVKAGICLRRAGRDRRLAHRGERHQPHLHRRDRAADRQRRGRRPHGRRRRLAARQKTVMRSKSAPRSRIS